MDALPIADDDTRPRRRRRSEERGPKHRKARPAKKRGGGLLIVGVVTGALVLGGGVGAIAYLFGQVILEDLTVANAPVTSASQGPAPPADPAPKPAANPTPPPSQPALPPQPTPPPDDPDRPRLNGGDLTIHPGGTRLVRYGPDGASLAALGSDGVLKVVELPGYKTSSNGSLMVMNVGDWKLKAYRETNRKRLAFAYSGDGTRLVAAGGGPRDAHVYLRDGPTARLKGDFPAGDGEVCCLALAADGKLLAVGFDAELGPGGTVVKSLVRLWDISGEPKALGTLEDLAGTLVFWTQLRPA